MKNTKEITSEYRIAYWIEKMQERSTSGLSIKAYCEREGVHTNVYFYWQRKLRKLAVAGLQARKPEISQLPPSGWTQVSARDEVEKKESNEVTIEIGKCRVPVNAATDTELLTKVCKVLVGLC